MSSYEAGPMELVAIGVVRSSLEDPAVAPKQGTEGGPDAWVEIDMAYRDALDGVEVGDEVLVLTWLDRAQRDVLQVHPRDDLSQPLRGVFGTRSQDRPNPIGLHPVRVLAIEGERVRVSDLEAVDGTPVVDIKPVL